LDIEAFLCYSRRNRRFFVLVRGDELKAMVLAAGLGTRLLPLTREIAKPAIPFVNRPLIHYSLDWLVRNGIHEAVINLHHRPHSIVSAIRERAWPLKIHFSHEPMLLGTAGGLKKAERHLSDETFVMINSDSLFEIDLSGPLTHHRENQALATMVLRKRSHGDSYGTVRVDGEGRIIEVGERGRSQGEGRGYVFTGIHLFEPEIFEWIPPNRFFEINQGVYPRLIQEDRRVLGYGTDTFWAEVGSHRTYLQAHGDFFSRFAFGVVSESDLSGRAELTPPVLIGKGCRIADMVRVGPSVAVGNHCQIGQGAVVENSVIWNDVVVGQEAQVKGSILGHRTTIEKGSQLQGMVVCGGQQKRIG
jgi:mannose-1-phosphate guanylyltransferase